jgi:predicted permease
MKKLSGFDRLRRIFNRNRFERDMQEELEFHLENRIRDNMANGMPPQEARRTALLDFGGVEQILEECREAGGYRFFNEIRQDMRYALRQLKRSPGFTILTALVLALGIGANTAVFSILDKLIYKPLPVHEPDRLVSLKDVASYPDYLDIRKDDKAFSDVATTCWFPLELYNSDHSEELSGRSVSANFFNVLGLKMAAGRTFLSEEDRLSGYFPVVIISYRYWERWFRSDPGAIGKTLRINGKPLTIVGVAPKGFRDIDYNGAYRDIWIPVSMFIPVQALENDPLWFDILEHRGKPVFRVIGRLKPGISLVQAQVRMKVVNEQLNKAYPPESRKSKGGAADGSEIETKLNIQLVSLNAPRVPGDSTLFSLKILLIASTCILLIACSNVGGLLLARASTRKRELATRTAIGAGRFRLIRQLLTESLVLTALSLTASFAFWMLALRSLPAFEGSLGEGSIGSLSELELTFEPRIFLIAAGISLLTIAIFAVGPAILSSRQDPGLSLKDRDTLQGGCGLRWRRLLVIAQVILSFALLIGAGLFIRFITSFQSAKPAFDQQVLVATVGTPFYGTDPVRVTNYYRQIDERIRKLAGVRSVGWAAGTPPETGDDFRPVRPKTSGNQQQEFAWIGSNQVSPGYFETLRFSIIMGRTFTERDTDRTSSTIIINQTMARQFWPGESPIGKQIELGRRLHLEDDEGRFYEVIGIVQDAEYSNVWNGPNPNIYFPIVEVQFRMPVLHVRVTGNPQSVMPSIRKFFTDFGPDAEVRNIQTMSSALQSLLARERSTLLVLTLFGILALLLSSIGLYGILSYSVTRRYREFGIRLALGAKRANVLMLVFREGLVMVLTGLAIGLPVSMALAKLLESRLHNMSPLDPITYIAVSGLWIVITLIAVIVPARKALKNPLEALRFE